MNGRILVIDDEKSIRFTFENFLNEEGYNVVSAKNYEEAVSLLSESDFDLIFVDILLEDRSGIDFLREVRERSIQSPVVMITGHPNLETASEAVRLGAFDYLSKPVRKKELLHVAAVALQYKAVIDKNEKYRSNLEAIFSSVKDAIIMIDKELLIVEINESASNICGLSRDQVGMPFNSLPHGCNGKCLEAVEATIEKKEPVELYRVECRPKQMNRQIVSITTSPLFDHKGLFSGTVLVVRDETRLADLERDLEERQQFHNIVGTSEKMQHIYNLVESLADVSTTVLLTGESGTGKELVAEAIHYRGARSSKPLVKVNCSALPETLLESELFGHIKGAFTNAIYDKVGRFQMADGGTIFLDEIGDMTPHMQLRLLRVLQDMEFERVGDSTPLKVDVRVIAATNKSLSRKVKQGEFREDLYYRLKVIEMTLPPLRDRREDIPLLVKHFLKKFNKKLQKDIEAVSDDVQKIFMEYPWPGNVRELEHSVEHAFILCRQPTIAVEHLPADLKNFRKTEASLKDDRKDLDSRALLNALEKTDWNKAKAARLLGMSRRTLYRKIEEYNIRHPE